MSYFDCLENGYEAPNGKAPHRDVNTEYESKDEAFKALEKEYLQLPIDRTSSPTLKKYYVPWLNLYPKSVSVASISIIKPPCEAELRVLVDVDNPIKSEWFLIKNFSLLMVMMVQI